MSEHPLLWRFSREKGVQAVMLMLLAKGLRIFRVEALGPRAEFPPRRPKASSLPLVMLGFKNQAEH